MGCLETIGGLLATDLKIPVQRLVRDNLSNPVHVDGQPLESAREYRSEPLSCLRLCRGDFLGDEERYRSFNHLGLAARCDAHRHLDGTGYQNARILVLDGSLTCERNRAVLPQSPQRVDLPVPAHCVFSASLMRPAGVVAISELMNGNRAL